MKYDFNGKTVIISGATSGLGREMTVQLLSRYGCRVIGIGRNAERAEELKRSLGAAAERFSYRLFDVSERSEWERLAAETEKADVLINNAGMMPEFKACPKPEETERAMAVNFLSAVYSSEAFLEKLKASPDGAIVNISSADALAAVAGTAAYAASKGALRSYSEALAQDLKGKVFVSTVYPGFIKTDIFRNQTEGADSKLIDRFCSRCDVAAAKILRGIVGRRRKLVIGADAHFMSIGYRFLGNGASDIMRRVLKASRLDLFKKVF